MYKLILFYLACYFYISIAYGQPDIIWQRCYGGTDADFFRDAIGTSDGGFITSLYTSSDDGDLEGVESPLGWVIKLDSSFEIQWQKFYSTVISVMHL